ncbi:hypothetical protein HCU74_10225 [Spongiibacter sp. KMU-166]|uniref:2-keto-4-pentenoate hydratase n=1 Tax=Spongiibacter thalassae TaxID=2721624 RepID=A0ABX1GHX4_9GAMM|nr:hypothetical protein [Spongiibacter thalassae]NKI17799.1 hypothetical protein [Spongiibacter thalassae]
MFKKIATVALGAGLISGPALADATGCGDACANNGLWGSAYVEQNIRYLDRFPDLMPAGYKLGLGTATARERFGSDRPIFGLLPPTAVLLRGEHISAASFGKGMIEAELAYRLKRRVDQPVASVAELRSLVDLVAPCFELPDLAPLGSEPGVFELVAGSVAASRFYIGAGVPVSTVDLDGIRVRLSYDGDTLADDKASSVMGGQWQALLALINNRVASGWSIDPEQWLLTGAIGGMYPLKEGVYKAKFDGLGKLKLEVAE